MRAASCALLGSHETNRMQRSAYTLCSCAHDVPINFQLEGGSGEAQRAAFERVSQCVQEDCGSVSPASARLACTTSKHVHTAGGWVLAGAHSAQRLGRASERERGGLLVQLAVHRAQQRRQHAVHHVPRLRRGRACAARGAADAPPTLLRRRRRRAMARRVWTGSPAMLGPEPDLVRERIPGAARLRGRSPRAPAPSGPPGYAAAVAGTRCASAEYAWHRTCRRTACCLDRVTCADGSHPTLSNPICIQHRVGLG
jgi:hypothetical protein